MHINILYINLKECYFMESKSVLKKLLVHFVIYIFYVTFYFIKGL